MFILLEDSIKRSTNFDEIVDKDLKDLLPQKCPCSGPYVPAFVLNTERYGVFPYSIWMWGNGDQDKSEKVQMVTLFTQWLLLNNCGEYDDVEEILIEVKNFQIKKSTTKTKRVTQETIAFFYRRMMNFPNSDFRISTFTTNDFYPNYALINNN